MKLNRNPETPYLPPLVLYVWWDAASWLPDLLNLMIAWPNFTSIWRVFSTLFFLFLCNSYLLMNVIWISSFNELYDSFNFLLMMTAKNGAFFCPLKHDVRLATSQRSQNIFEIAFEFLHPYNFMRSLTIFSILDVKIYQETNTWLSYKISNVAISERIWLHFGVVIVLAAKNSFLAGLTTR